ncbi:hypothetical protein HPB51_011998 [Rhipicephalus microplus]|uniref:Uncharacterized protein n=1 Tax=Rhipicephalus microplus TaxID=6941 RepID=A0A9J6F218_RHIMP|nr:hypothetical protein HPB51_011998 [Rhipicephalus microplus]
MAYRLVTETMDVTSFDPPWCFGRWGIRVEERKVVDLFCRWRARRPLPSGISATRICRRSSRFDGEQPREAADLACCSERLARGGGSPTFPGRDALGRTAPECPLVNFEKLYDVDEPRTRARDGLRQNEKTRSLAMRVGSSPTSTAPKLNHLT